MKIESELNEMLDSIARQTGQARSKAEAQEKGLPVWLDLDHHQEYGGFRVIPVKVENGGVPASDWGSGEHERRKGPAMRDYLRGVLIGLRLAKGEQ